ncbi:hypothetical protein GCM10017643_39780 [Ancylobacter dichloromethanicus]|uniref:Uncharacterized protein n=1 Tax=Ancylobacter dichloromethanicus TaxID=518825 RepID=A0A9W6JAC7_9HYPH|nr:hypothetical protein GCM10017643_39780 [Ancylobacter dichloromethanicus]
MAKKVDRRVDGRSIPIKYMSMRTAGTPHAKTRGHAGSPAVESVGTIIDDSNIDPTPIIASILLLYVDDCPRR